MRLLFIFEKTHKFRIVQLKLREFDVQQQKRIVFARSFSFFFSTSLSFVYDVCII